MTDAELIDYCEVHCKTERALFSPEQINRMIVLAGWGEHNATVKTWCSCHEEMQELVNQARAIRAEAGWQ